MTTPLENRIFNTLRLVKELSIQCEGLIDELNLEKKEQELYNSCDRNLMEAIREEARDSVRVKITKQEFDELQEERRKKIAEIECKNSPTDQQ